MSKLNNIDNELSFEEAIELVDLVDKWEIDYPGNNIPSLYGSLINLDILLGDWGEQKKRGHCYVLIINYRVRPFKTGLELMSFSPLKVQLFGKSEYEHKEIKDLCEKIHKSGEIRRKHITYDEGVAYAKELLEKSRKDT